MKSFMEWLMAEEQAFIQNPPKNELQRYYIDCLNKLYKPSTVELLNKNPDFYKPHMMYKIIFDSMYKFLRVPDKKSGEHYDDVPHQNDIEDVTSKPNSMVRVDNKDGWHYRLPHSFSRHPRAAHADPSQKDGRISMAALANKDLIEALDDYVANRRLAYYKTPDSSDNWTERHDPITMYFKEPITQEVRDELSKLFGRREFNRAMHKQNKLAGDQFASGMAQETSPRTSDISDALDRIKSVNPAAGAVVESELRSRGGQLRASSGQMAVMDDFIKVLGLEKKPIAPAAGQQGAAPKTDAAHGQQGGGQPFSLGSLAGKVGDPDWHTVYDVFARRFRKNPKDPETQKMGSALYAAGTSGDMGKIKSYVDIHARAQRIS